MFDPNQSKWRWSDWYRTGEQEVIQSWDDVIEKQTG